MLSLPRFILSTIALFLLLTASTAMAAPVDITADQISRTADGIVVAKGNVVIKRTTDTLQADEVKYLAEQHILEAKGHVIITSSQATIHAEKAVMHTKSKTGNMQKAVITLPGGERLTAERVKRIDDQTFEAEQLIFSSCPIDAESWRIAASRALLDQEDGSLSTTHPRFELWGVPVLYAPWWQQPLRRKSGLLMPKVGSGKRRGTQLGVPLYFAPTENWDATFTPHWMSARGFMGETEIRHVSRLGNEQIHVAGIRDTVTNTSRNRLKGELHWTLPANIRLDAVGDHVSDHDYLADYSTGDDIVSAYLRSIATLSQSAQLGAFEGTWSVLGAHQQNLLLANNATTLQIWPQIESSMQLALHPSFILHFDQQTTRFNRRSGVDGWRVDLHPYIEIPWQLAGGGISATLMAGAQHTRYWLKQTTVTNLTPKRTIFEGSFEVRSDFEYIGKYRTWRHVISPVARYDYVDAPNQASLPNFDSAFGLLTWNNLLSGNRYSGYDRIEKANRISLMLESRLQFKDSAKAAARDALVLRAGASYDLLRQSVDNRLQAAPTRPFSNLLGEVIWQPVRGISLYSSGQYNTAGRYWANLLSNAYISFAGNNLNIGYSFTDARYSAAVQLFSMSAKINLGGQWLATGGWQYDMLLKTTRQSTVGLQYTHACWKLGVEGYKTNRRSGTTTASDLGFRLLLEFKGLGSVGS